MSATRFAVCFRERMGCTAHSCQLRLPPELWAQIDALIVKGPNQAAVAEDAPQSRSEVVEAIIRANFAAQS